VADANCPEADEQKQLLRTSEKRNILLPSCQGRFIKLLPATSDGRFLLHSR
jgi:hypothetical protein